MIDLSVNKQFYIILCPNLAFSNSLPDCDTVIAHLKIWTVDSVKMIKLCDFRQELTPDENLITYWPLTYNITKMPTYEGELTDLGVSKYRSKFKIVSPITNADWSTMG